MAAEGISVGEIPLWFQFVASLYGIIWGYIYPIVVDEVSKTNYRGKGHLDYIIQHYGNMMIVFVASPLLVIAATFYSAIKERPRIK